MQTDLWKKVEALYQAALTQPSQKRAACLAHACPGDPQLRDEVQSLLDQQADSYCRRPGSTAWPAPTDACICWAPEDEPTCPVSSRSSHDQ